MEKELETEYFDYFIANTIHQQSVQDTVFIIDGIDEKLVY